MLAEVANLMAFAAVACVVIAFAAWLTSRRRVLFNIPPVLKRVRKAKTTAAASLLLVAVGISAIAAVIAVAVRFLG